MINQTATHAPSRRQSASPTMTAAAILSVTLAGAGFASDRDGNGSQKSAPVRPVLVQKQLVSGSNCESAAVARSKPDFLSSNAEYRDDVLITVRYCDATAHNQLNPTKPEIVVVSADPRASGDQKILLKTVAKSNAKELRETCVLLGQAAVTYSQPSTTATPQADRVVAGAEVLTSSGKTDCEPYLRATEPDNPLVVLAPSVISGYPMSVHILNMIAVKEPATDVQAAVEDLRHQVALSVAQSAEDVRKHPQIVLKP